MAAFKLSERLPLPPDLSANDLPRWWTQVPKVRRIKKIDCHLAEGDEDSAPESISDTDHWLHWNGELDNPYVSKDDWEADDESDVELDIVLSTDLEHHFGSGSGLEPNPRQNGSHDCQSTRNVNSGTVQWISHNPSQLAVLVADCPAGPSVDSYNAMAFAFDNCIWLESLIQHPVIPFWMLCRIWYQLFWNHCFCFCVLYLGLPRKSIALV